MGFIGNGCEKGTESVLECTRALRELLDLLLEVFDIRDGLSGPTPNAQPDIMRKSNGEYIAHLVPLPPVINAPEHAAGSRRSSRE